MAYAVMKKRTAFRLEENLIKAMKAMAQDRRWDMTTIVEMSLENVLKAAGYLDEKGNLTDKVQQDDDPAQSQS